jgi:OOP family OmpA-OmpF porin
MQPSTTDDRPPTIEADDLSRVRELLLGAEYDDLIALKNLINDPAAFSSKLSTVISEAMSQRFQQDESLAEVLAPAIQGAIQQSIVSNPHAVAESLYPIMGPAIRKSISETLSQMLSNMNQLLEQSLSPKSIGWRIDAWRSGRSYSEIVLMNTMEYQVEQVFLIHSESSLLIQHKVADMAITKDPDMVSSMLSAIQDYIHDSFSGNEDEILNSMQMGDLTVIIEKGPRAILAAVVRGKVPENLKTLFAESLEDIHKRCGNTLVEYSGDPDDFLNLEPILEKCLTFQMRDSNKQKKIKIPWFALVGILFVVVAVSYSYYQRSLLADWRYTAVKNLEVEPGLVVINSHVSEGGRLLIRGLRDPLSKPPELVAIKNLPHEIDVDFDFQGYISVEPDILTRRANKLFSPPLGAALIVNETTLVATGEAELQWVDELQNKWSSIYGIEQLDDSALIRIDPVFVEMVAAKTFIESTIFSFELSAVELVGDDIHLEALAAKIIRLYELYKLDDDGYKIEVQVIGSTDQSGTKSGNLGVARQRASNLYTKLLVLNVPRESMSFHAMQELPEFDNELQKRQVVFKVVGMMKEHK